jgi:hypothetical protein
MAAQFAHFRNVTFRGSKIMAIASTIRFWAAAACVLVVSSNSWANQAPTMDSAPPALRQPDLSTPAPGAQGMTPKTSAAPQATAEPGSGCGLVCCQPRMIEQTCYVPTPSYEKRKVQCVQYQMQPREQTVTVMHVVPQKQTITRDCQVMVPETRTRTENYTACKPVPSGNCCGCCKYVEEPRQRVIQYTVCVPHTERRSYDVTVCKYVPEQKTVTVNECVPYTVEKEVDVCVYHLVAHKVMVPEPTCCCPPCWGPPCCGWNTWGRW